MEASSTPLQIGRNKKSTPSACLRKRLLLKAAQPKEAITCKSGCKAPLNYKNNYDLSIDMGFTKCGGRVASVDFRGAWAACGVGP